MARRTLLLVLLAAGCAVSGPDYHRPEMTMPGAFGELAVSGQKSSAVARATAVASWWTVFGDPALDRLVERAANANLDLRRATVAVRQARAVRAGAAAGELPSVGVSGSYERGRPSQNGIAFESFPGHVSSSDLYRAGFDAAWEIDVFGGVRREIEAADAGVGAAIENRRDVLVSVLAEVAFEYIQLRGFQRQIAIAEDNLGAQRQTLDITKSRFEQGVISDLDVAQADAQVAITQAVIPSLEASARQAIHALGVLLGEQPMALAQELAAPAPIPGVPAEVPVGLPSDLLARRPDVRRAERRLAEETARIGVAVADLYPQFSVSAALGLESTKFKTLGDYASRFWSIGPGVKWNVFDGGKTRANIAVQEAAAADAALAYEQSVLVALRDVEDALIAYAKQQLRREALTSAVAANRRAVSISNEQYTHGRVAFTTVLDAQRSLFATEDALVRSESDVSSQLVALYKALGGGWVSEPR